MFGVFAAPTARIKAIDKTRNEWVDRTGELPPDFDAPPKQPFLPDAFDGVRTREDWTRRRPEIRGSIEKCITGRMPPAPEQCSRHRDKPWIAPAVRRGSVGCIYFAGRPYLRFA
jgi:hypothetical protein